MPHVHFNRHVLVVFIDASHLITWPTIKTISCTVVTRLDTYNRFPYHSFSKYIEFMHASSFISDRCAITSSDNVTILKETAGFSYNLSNMYSCCMPQTWFVICTIAIGQGVDSFVIRKSAGLSYHYLVLLSYLSNRYSCCMTQTWFVILTIAIGQGVDSFVIRKSVGLTFIYLVLLPYSRWTISNHYFLNGVRWKEWQSVPINFWIDCFQSSCHSRIKCFGLSYYDALDVLYTLHLDFV